MVTMYDLKGIRFFSFVTLVIVSLSIVLLYNIEKIVFTEASIDVNFTEFKSTKFLLKVMYPTNWNIIETNQNFIPNTLNSVALFKSPTNTTSMVSDASVNIQVYGNLSLDRFTQFVNRNLNNLSIASLEFKLLSKNITLPTSELSNANGIALFEFKGGNKENSGVRIYKMNDSNVYILTFITEPSKYKLYFPIFQQMEKSFSIMKDSQIPG